MTALKPIENRNVRAVASETYPSNLICAHPDCTEKVQLRSDGTPTVHHIFPRGQIKGKSYFVAITEDEAVEIVPHAVGLCGSGTTGHHGDVEEHRAWIKLEDGVYVWYDRYAGEAWVELGPLNPQPGSREGKAKRRKFSGEAKRKRVNWQVRVPADQEDGAGILDDGLEEAYKIVCKDSDIEPDESTTDYVKLSYVFHWVGLHA